MSTPGPSYRITVADIDARRKKEGRLVASTAAVTDVDSFKTYSGWKSLPKAKRWDHHLSKESASREPCVLKSAAKYLKKPDMISLGGGLPTPEHFPIQSISMRIATGETGFTEAAAASTEGGKTVTIGKYDSTQPAENPVSEYDIAVGLNYGQAIGSTQMLRWVIEHTELVCTPAYSDWSVSLTVGSTSALDQALRMFCDRERNDMILTEEYSFSSALETAAPLGIRVVGVSMDEQGLLPERLDEILSGWDVAARGAPKPHVLYTVPSGQNPTGATQSLERRHAVYEVCCKHDVFIIEDEPYYFLQMPDYAPKALGTSRVDPLTTYDPSTLSTDKFLDSLVPTYVSLDREGRVMRMDSFSKVLVPGSRMGWITASAQIVERYVRHTETCTQGTNGFSQVMLFELLNNSWGHDGYIKWLGHIQASYTGRRDVLLDACEDFLPKDVVSWVAPTAGMFHWLRVDETKHPKAKELSLLALEEEIFDRCIEKGVLVARGSWFAAEQDKPLPGLFFRATFAAASAEKMTEAIRRFGEAVRESYGL